MKKLAAFMVVAVVAVSVAAGLAYSAKKPKPGFPSQDMVFGGGHFVFGAGHTFSVSDVNGRGTLVFNTDAILARLTCMTVSGNVAAIGGVISSTADGANVGLPIKMYFVDNGRPSGSTLGGDEVSSLIIGAPGPAPSTCPAADASQATSPLDAGDVAVHAAGS